MSRSVAFLATISLLALAACTVPLAPGYRIVKETREVNYAPGPTPVLHVRAQYSLNNSGAVDLNFMDLNLPAEKTYGRKNLHIEVDGHESRIEPLPSELQPDAPNTVRVPFDSAWKRGQIRDVKVGYDFSSPEDSGTRITLNDGNFHLGSRGWYPLPQPPRHLLSPYPRRPDRVIYSVRVPADFQVLARGRLVQKRNAIGGVEYRFELLRDDLTPFIVAGHYVSSGPDDRSAQTVFWTFQPPTQNVTAAAGEITSAWDALEKAFGPLDKHITAPHIVEAGGVREHIAGAPGPGAAAFPGGVLVNSEAIEEGVGSQDFQERVEHALAHNWFGDQVFFAPDAALGMGEGLPEYATIAVEETRKGEAGRHQRVERYLREYDDARSHGSETPLGVTMLSDPVEVRRIALAKAPLFYVALEDTCGPSQMQSGLAHMVTLLRGQETSYDALRATLEESSGKNLAEIFRVWLNDKDVPQDFRSRYQGSSSSAHEQSRN